MRGGVLGSQCSRPSSCCCAADERGGTTRHAPASALANLSSNGKGGRRAGVAMRGGVLGSQCSRPLSKSRSAPLINAVLGASSRSSSTGAARSGPAGKRNPRSTYL